MTIARLIDTSSINACAPSITCLRSRLSATAPDQSDSSRMGNAVDAWTSATICDDGVSDVISHDAPTDWINPPKLDAMLAIHTARNTGIDNGAEGAASAIVSECALIASLPSLSLASDKLGHGADGATIPGRAKPVGVTRHTVLDRSSAI
ncbi:hypothetical protein SPHINGOAX6_50043 [Sphingomonas sp. AX6]|nr:hypothetical protein SPHINGOAX6_50043 [Sphingomonas sp. AX6]